MIILAIVFFKEEKKILFYHPQETDIDSKIKDVGLSEAIVKFSKLVFGI